MESDLSLIEIAGEDDSLLQQIPNDDVSTLNSSQRSNYSDYFLCSPLQLPRSKSTEGKIVNGDPEKTSSSCTDSINIEKNNSSKAEAPKLSVERQQMKRKKKGGGYNLRKSLAWDSAFFIEEGFLNSEELSMISGDCGKSSGNMLSVIEEEGPNCSNDSSDLQALEENLFEELPAISSSKERRTGVGLLTKHDSSPTVKRKVLSAHDVNTSGSKRSGCPRPVASSSLKRPANSNTTKAATKDPKISKLPVLKPYPGAVSRIPKSVIPCASGSKGNQMALPAINIQKNSRLKASSNNSRNVLNNAKPVPAGKPLTTKTSLGQARRNVASSVKRLSTDLKLSPVTIANNSLEVTSDPSFPSARFVSKADDGSSNPPLTSAQYASKADDGSRKNATSLPKNACYTGVNMQRVQPQIAKPSGLRMPSPSLGFFGQPKAPSLHNPLNRNSQPCNLPKSTVPAAQNPIHELRPPLVPQKIPKVVNGGATAVNVKVPCSNSGSSVPSTVNAALIEHIELLSQGTDIPKVEKMVQHDQNSYEAIKNQNTLRRVVDMDHQLVEPAEPRISETTSQMEDKELQRTDKNCEVGLSDENQMLQTSNEDLLNKSLGPEELHSFSCAEVVDVCSKVQDSSASEIENSNASSHLQFIEKEKDDNRAVDEVKTKSHAGGPSLDGSITVAISNSNLKTSMDVNEKYKHLESLNTPITGEQGSAVDASNLDDCLASANNFYSEESTDKTVPHCVEYAEPDGIGTSKSESKHFGAPCLIPLAMLDHGSNLDKLDSHTPDDTTGGSEQGVENYNLDSQFLHDIEHHEHSTYMELENVDEDQLTGAEKPKDVEVICQKSGHSNGGELKNPFSTCEDLENKEVNLLVENSCPNPKLQPEGEFCPFHEDNPKDQIVTFRGIMNVGKHHEEQGKVIVSCFSEIDRIAYREKQSIEVQDLLAEDSEYLEESHKLNRGNSADVNSSGVEIADGLSVYEHMEQASKENDGVIGDAFVQACNGSSLVDSCNSDKSSGVNSQYLVVDKKNKQSGNCELQKSGYGIEQIYTDNVPGFYLNATLVANNSSGEFKDENVSAFEQFDGRGDDNALVASVMQDGNLDVNKEAENLEMVIAVTDSIKIEPPIETMQCSAQPQHRHENELSSQVTSLEFDLSSKVNSNQISRDPLTFNTMSFSSLDEESVSSVMGEKTSLSARILGSYDISVLTDKILPNEAENILSRNSHTINSELQHELGNTIPTDDISAGAKGKSGNDKKQDSRLIKPPSNAVPFSDEWLAAFEAAGEEILTTKSGAVQHSPPDKSQPEPGPWSPVKRKNTQVIGPFDCTKYSNITNIPPSRH
ncbi:uncharacterized protein LOC107411275 isoform X2 [Ziziphus jujuba]|uniref:Uncharacterized protein LOC107411275 isoform X2 n=1 Tax=Ziziphus jujuba TaxID=326968 RepID=A0ABM3I9D1_ZIZJJ|nr:uncharacterized protein LOC107411275 isoform X2 [Ziziphus jujuba]